MDCKASAIILALLSTGGDFIDTLRYYDINFGRNSGVSRGTKYYVALVNIYTFRLQTSKDDVIFFLNV